MSHPTTRPPTAPPVGNDVVELTHPRCRGKGTDERFLRRVLGTSELESVRVATDPDLALWRRWAAKEAAFKAVTLLRGEPPAFVHASFVVEETDPAGGVVRWEGLALPWRVSGGRSVGGVHAVAWWDGGPGKLRLEGGTERLSLRENVPLELLLKRLSEREGRAVHSTPSALVRLHARRHLARLMGGTEEALEIVSAEGPPGRTPPRVFLDGQVTDWSVGLSHHGSLLGWVLARWERDTEMGGDVVAPGVPAPEEA